MLHLPLPSPPLVTAGFPVNRFPFFVIHTSLFLRFHISDIKVFVFLKLVSLRILLSPSMLLQTSEYSLWPSIPVCCVYTRMYICMHTYIHIHHTFIHASIDEHFGCFHVFLAIVNNADVNIGLCVSFRISVSALQI